MSIDPRKIIAVALALAFLLYACVAVVTRENAEPLLVVAVLLFLMALLYRPDES